MVVYFEKEYLDQLYTTGKTTDKKHRFQPHVAKRFVRAVDLMKKLPNVMSLNQYGGLHYEHLIGDKKGMSSIRISDQYRLEFVEECEDNEIIATICNIVELSNHYD